MTKTNIFRAGLLIMLMMLVLAPAAAQRTGRDAQPTGLESSASPTDRAYLREVAAEQGTVRVIVGLQVDQPGRMAFATMSEMSQQAVIAQTQDALLSELGVTRSATGVRRFTALPLLALDLSAEQFEALESSTLVTGIQENRFREIALDIATGNIGMTGEGGAWDLGADGSGQHIVILNSGVEGSHQFLTGKVVEEWCYSTNSTPSGFTVTSLCPGGVPSSNAIGSALPCTVVGGQCDHGTHIAGIAAGDGSGFDGVAREADIIAMQVYSKITDGATNVCFRLPNGPGDPGPDHPGYPFHECILAADGDILAGMDRAYQLRNTFDIAAVNMSLGSGYYMTQAECDADLPAYNTAVDLLVGVGIAVVSSAGNQGLTDQMNAPACISGMISVGATCDAPYTNLDSDPDIDCNVNTIAPFTNSTSFLSFMAPGVNINSSVPGNIFGARTGTSQATAFVSGAFAALRSRRPGTSVEQLKTALYDTGFTVSDVGGIFKRIQVNAAIASLNFPDQPTLLTPEPNAAFAETPITFKWTAGSDTNRYTLEIYKADGSEKLTNVNVQHEICADDAEFPDEGKVCTADIIYAFKDDKFYLWKVIAKNTENDTHTDSEIRPFQFDTPGRAPLIAPVHKIVINEPEELFQFQWEEVALATSYRVTMYQKSNGEVKINTPELDELAVCAAEVCTYTTSPADQATLDDDTKYKWYVTSISVDGTSKSDERTIKAKIPAAPLLTSPEDAFVFTSLTDIELTWTEVAGADEYRLDIVDTGSGEIVITDTLNVELRTITCLSGVCTYVPSVAHQGVFQNKHVYSWTVTASNEVGSNESDPLTFKTKFPAPPVLIAPATGVTFQDPAITFTFSQIANADSYELFIVQLSNDTVVVQRGLTPGSNLICNGTDCSYTLIGADQSNLKNGKTYEWYVKSVSTAGKSKSDKREFTLQSPLPPTLTFPAADGKLHSPSDATFTWGDVGTGANYKLRVKDLKNGDKIVKVDVAGASCIASVCTYTLTGDQQSNLKDERQFKWWVIATNTVGSAKSAKLIFTTEYPRIPAPLTPAHNTTLTAAAELTVLEWVSGGTIAPVSYRLRIQRVDNDNVIHDETFTNGAGLTCDATKCTYTVSPAVQAALQDDRDYKWWVVAESASGSKTGDKFKFLARFP